MFRFAHIEFLYVLGLIPIFIFLFILAQRHKRKALQKFGNLEVVSKLMPDVSASRPVLKFWLSMAALAALLIVLAGPQFGSKLKEVKRKGVEIIIALDVSNSMLAEDIQPNRLERAKRAISRLVDKLSNDKIGLIVFAGDAYTQIPVTTDYVSAKMFLSSISPEIVPVQGTAIGSAIDLAMKSFSPDNELNKALVIITDGENHEGNAEELAAEAAKNGIIVHTLGMGLPKGAPIPITAGSSNFIKDENGNTVISKLNENMLQKISANGNGMYIRANNSETGLNKLFDEIRKMDQQEFETKQYSEYEDRFQYLTALAIILLILEFLILERRSKWFDGLNLFKVDERRRMKK